MEESNNSTMSQVLVIDFEACILKNNENPENREVQEVVDNVHQALTTIGFFHLRNFGIPADTIANALRVSKSFFTLSEAEKSIYKSGVWMPGTFHGWVPTDLEGLDPRDDKKDFKESFNFMARIKETPNNEFPDIPEVPDMKTALLDLFESCRLLHHKIMEIMAKGLGLKDKMMLADMCQLIGQPDNTTTLRTLYYPPIPVGADTDKLIRCGEHSDYGSISLLFQDDKGGLEVKDISGRWIPIHPIPDTVLVNVGDLMQRWTSDRYIAAKHRVVFTPDANKSPRQSLVFFGNPDDDVIVKCLDGSDKYPAVRSLDYNHGRARKSHLKPDQ